jgi:hypothetical protein
MTGTVETVAQKSGATSVCFKKLPTAHSCPTGGNSPNLATLLRLPLIFAPFRHPVDIMGLAETVCNSTSNVHITVSAESFRSIFHLND